MEMDLDNLFLAIVLFVAGCFCLALGLIVFLIFLRNEIVSISNRIQATDERILNNLEQIRLNVLYIKLQLMQNIIEGSDRPPPYTE